MRSVLKQKPVAATADHGDKQCQASDHARTKTHAAHDVTPHAQRDTRQAHQAQRQARLRTNHAQPRARPRAGLAARYRSSALVRIAKTYRGLQCSVTRVKDHAPCKPRAPAHDHTHTRQAASPPKRRPRHRLSTCVPEPSTPSRLSSTIGRPKEFVHAPPSKRGFPQPAHKAYGKNGSRHGRGAGPPRAAGPPTRQGPSRAPSRPKGAMRSWVKNTGARRRPQSSPVAAGRRRRASAPPAPIRRWGAPGTAGARRRPRTAGQRRRRAPSHPPPRQRRTGPGPSVRASQAPSRPPATRDRPPRGGPIPRCARPVQAAALRGAHNRGAGAGAGALALNPVAARAPPAVGGAGAGEAPAPAPRRARTGRAGPRRPR